MSRQRVASRMVADTSSRAYTTTNAAGLLRIRPLQPAHLMCTTVLFSLWRLRRLYRILRKWVPLLRPRSANAATRTNLRNDEYHSRTIQPTRNRLDRRQARAFRSCAEGSLLLTQFFFTTIRGFIRLGPNVQEGDDVVILYGGRVPILLRRQIKEVADGLETVLSRDPWMARQCGNRARLTSSRYSRLRPGILLLEGSPYISCIPRMEGLTTLAKSPFLDLDNVFEHHVHIRRKEFMPLKVIRHSYPHIHGSMLNRSCLREGQVAGRADVI
jgi:hypothetical protein